MSSSGPSAGEEDECLGVGRGLLKVVVLNA